MSLRSALRLPKEHGAWVMFYVPFVLGVLVAGKFSLPVLLLLLAALLALAVTRSLPLFVLLAFAPVLARTCWSLLKPAPSLNLKRIGISEITYSLIFLLFTTLSFRLAM